MPSSQRSVPPPMGVISVKQWTMVKATFPESRNWRKQSLSICQVRLLRGSSGMSVWLSASVPTAHELGLEWIDLGADLVGPPASRDSQFAIS